MHIVCTLLILAPNKNILGPLPQDILLAPMGTRTTSSLVTLPTRLTLCLQPKTAPLPFVCEFSGPSKTLANV